MWMAVTSTAPSATPSRRPTDQRSLNPEPRPPGRGSLRPPPGAARGRRRTVPALTLPGAVAVRTFSFDTELWLPSPPEALFPFFAEAGNLERITPPWLRFRVLRQHPDTMGAGTLIDYRLRLHGVPVSWRTRIAVWEPPHRFVDEQLRGPYRLWVHEHTFAAEGGGTRCRDRVRYAVPGGRLVDSVLVRRDVRRIFAFRAGVLESLFGGPGPAAAVPGPAGAAQKR